ncbi:MAG: redoxin domain-containing protein [Candidatus Kapabacteria bacterium]|nr:redoxin domain-containing protein [Candidatus Kapabacteria bacterium]
MNSTLNDFSVTDINGATTQLSSYSGKVVVVVNVASFCGYTKQYATLEKLYKTYSDKGLVVLGFPSNDFGEQEPGTDAEIKAFCTTNFNVSFPLFSKIDIKGANKAPLYAWLTSGDGNKTLEGEVRWNFEKFIIGRDGNVRSRHKCTEDPMSESFVRDIEAALAE